MCLGVMLASGLSSSLGQTVTIDTSPAGRHQRIDGFGTCLAGTEGEQAWWQQLYFDDLRASILRMDLTPVFHPPYSDFTYNSPWFHNNPALPGPDNNNVRAYTNAADYTRLFAGRRAPIAVMGPDLNQNTNYFNFNADGPRVAGLLARIGTTNAARLGGFKLIASHWSPGAVAENFLGQPHCRPKRHPAGQWHAVAVHLGWQFRRRQARHVRHAARRVR